MSGIKSILRQREHKEPLTTNNEAWLIKEIDRHLTSTSDQRPPSRNIFYPSYLGSTCDRLLYLHYNGLLPNPKFDSKTLRIFAHGHATENRYKDIFTKMRLLLGAEVQARYDNPCIHGRADFILNFPEFGRTIIELKTINERGFSSLSVPKVDHAIQLQIYLSILNIDNGFVLYECKNDQQLKAFHIKRSSSEWDAIIERCIKIQNMLEAPKLSTVTHDKWCNCLNVKEELEKNA